MGRPYDRDLTDIFAVQDDVTQRIVGALKVTLGPTEKAQIADPGTSSVDAYDCSLRGRELLLGNPKNRGTFEGAKASFLKAIELDPNYARAYAGLGFAYMFDYQNRWSDDPDGSLPLAKRYAEQAIEKNPKEPIARAVAAVAATFNGDLERAQSQISIALSLNPKLAMAYNISGTIHMYAGQPLEAIPLIERAMRLDPAANTQYLHFLGMANLLAGKYETAAALFKQRIALVPERIFHVPRSRPLSVISARSTRRSCLGRTHGDQPQILVRRTFEPAAFQAERGCPAARGRYRKAGLLN